jgi:AcrR family transcriptional regulator
MEENAMDRRWTATFERLPGDKRARVLDAAKRAFAASGFAGANVNDIAGEAGISVGSMYKYFRTKEDLFLTLIEEYHKVIADSIDAVLARESSFTGRVEALLRACVDTSLADPEAVRLYIACTTEELARLASPLSDSIEAVSASRYRAVIAEAQGKGEVEPGLDPGWAAFFLDDILLMTQFSVGSVYYRARLRLFLGAESEAWTPGELVERSLAFILRALQPRTPRDSR